jgi:hypothetical protein
LDKLKAPPKRESEADNNHLLIKSIPEKREWGKVKRQKRTDQLAVLIAQSERTNSKPGKRILSPVKSCFGRWINWISPDRERNQEGGIR